MTAKVFVVKVYTYAKMCDVRQTVWMLHNTAQFPTFDHENEGKRTSTIAKLRRPYAVRRRNKCNFHEFQSWWQYAITIPDLQKGPRPNINTPIESLYTTS